MADQPKADMVMKFTITAGTDISAECALDKAEDDNLMEGFNPQTYDSYSNFFEISKFNFNIKVHEGDSAVSNLSQSAKLTAKPSADNKKLTGQFVRWRSAKAEDLPKLKYPVEFDTFTFTRLIDGASPIFFQRCCNSQSFLSAALVKRVQTEVNKPTKGFLRIDFDHVLVTGIDWDDGDVLSETCKFICRGFVLQYSQQNDDGSLNTPSSAEWKQMLEQDGGSQ